MGVVILVIPIIICMNGKWCKVLSIEKVLLVFFSLFCLKLHIGKIIVYRLKVTVPQDF